MPKYDKKMQKWKAKRWKRINKRIERGVSFLVIMATVMLSVLEVLEKGDRVFTLKKFTRHLEGNTTDRKETNQ